MLLQDSQGIETAIRERCVARARIAMSVERRTVTKRTLARSLVARDHFISREDGTANLTECPTRRSFIALLIESD